MPELQMSLHTLIELEPRPDGTMVERRYKVNIDASDDSKVCMHLAILLLDCCDHRSSN